VLASGAGAGAGSVAGATGGSAVVDFPGASCATAAAQTSNPNAPTHSALLVVNWEFRRSMTSLLRRLPRRRLADVGVIGNFRSRPETSPIDLFDATEQAPTGANGESFAGARGHTVTPPELNRQ